MNKKIEQYIVADGNSIVELESAVSKLKDQGLTPAGGMAVNILPGISTSMKFMQAMVKYEDRDILFDLWEILIEINRKLPIDHRI